MANSSMPTTHNFRTPLDPSILYLANRLGGEKAKELERFLKFAVVGASGAVIDLGLLTLLQATILSPINAQGQQNDLNVAIATTIAFVSAVISNFIWTRLWVYPDSRSRSMRRQLAQFALVSVVGWIGRTVWVTLMYAPMGDLTLSVIQQFQASYSATPDETTRMGSVVAQLIAMVVVMLWNYFANRHWTYNDVD